jgi:NodT family efflux transporter outer membrane factor (OMF) lipoprotein
MTADTAKVTDGWKTAEPKDDAIRGKWWENFQDHELNSLEDQVNSANQTVAAAVANFLSARALVKQARSQYFPTASFVPSITRSRQPVFFNQAGGVSSGGRPVTLYTLPLDASWEPDLWGSIRNTVKANTLEAQAAAADLENVRLSVQAEIAADYYQIRALDSQKVLLDSTVVAYRESLSLTKTRFSTGIASDQDVAQAETQLNTTQAQATDLGIQRAQFEHAIAQLIGKPPSAFALKSAPLKAQPFAIPYGVPSKLLERRPDIAAAERRVAEANAQIGVARAAYFPTLSLTGTIGYENSSVANLAAWPSLVWSVGASLSQTLFDAGRRRAVTEQAWAAYSGKVATYRQTALTAFQEVEDILAALRILSEERQQQDEAVTSSRRYLALANDRYRLGIDSYLNVTTAQATLLTNERTSVNLALQQMTSTVQLIKALGGGWDPAKMAAEKEVSRTVAQRSQSPK